MNPLQLDWTQIGNVLGLLLVISVVFETALAALFNWRIFAQYCEGRGVKTPVTVVAAVTLLWSYDIDIFQQLIASFQSSAQSSFFGRIMTGLLVAGGSGAIFSAFTKLGLRNPKQLQEKAKETRAEAGKRKQQNETGKDP